MLKNLIVLSDGTELFSGAPGAAIVSLELTQAVNAGEELTLGSVCASMVEATVFTPDTLQLTAGEEVTLYKVDGDTRIQVGLFTLEKPVRKSDHTWSITAYDRVSRLDKDLTAWLAGLTGWPYSLYRLAEMVCTACGVTLANEELSNGGYAVQAFSADGITGRQLLQWVGEAAGRFCRATADGKIEFAWYAPAQVGVGAGAIGPVTVTEDATGIHIQGYPMPTEYAAGALGIASEALTLTDDSQGGAVLTAAALQQLPVYQGSLTVADYAAAPIEKVQLRQSSEDVGTVWPDTAEAANTYTVTGNYLLTAGSPEALLPIAQSLYEQLRAVTYTPCKLEIPANTHIGAGDILTVKDRSGRTVTAYVMTRVQAGQRDTLECTGSASRDSSTAVNNQSYKALSGKVLELKTDVEGLKIANREAGGKAASLALTVEGISAAVTRQETAMAGVQEQVTTLQQSAEAVKLSVQQIESNGASKVNNEFGLTIDGSAVNIHRSGSEMTNRLNEKGMYVVRDEGTSGETTMLQADADGVVASDVSVRSYLVIGDHARFEDYSDGTDGKRTACFWV